MRFLLIVVVALFGCVVNRADASPSPCDETGINFCPSIGLTITDAVTGKPTDDNFDNLPVVNKFELLNLQFTTTFQPPATGIRGIFGDPPLLSSQAYSFQPGSPFFIQTTDVSSELTNMGENFFLSGYFITSGLGKIDFTVIDNAGNSWTLGSSAIPGRFFDVLPSVPEPSTWAMLLIGFAGIGLMTYHRRSSAMLPA